MVPTEHLPQNAFPEARVVAVPSDLAGALEAAPAALHYFESLPYGRARRIVRTIEAARTAAGRRRRIAGAIARLHAEGAVVV